MEELLIEEKAKRYDSMFERLKEMYNNNKTNVAARLICERYFPELKECEDEMMIQYFKDLAPFDKADELYEKYGFSHKDAIAWLEKQAEHANFRNKIQIGDKATRNEDGVLVNLSQLKRVAKKDDKQGEQKPADKKGMNLVEEEMTPFQKEVFCIIDTAIEEEQGLKQVCDKLFALASNEIKQKPAWSEEDKEMSRFIGNAITANDASTYLKDKGIELIDAHMWLDELKDRVLPQPNPNQEWSEEDERVKIALFLFVESYGAYANYEVTQEEMLSWLKSLRPQKQWKPSDEQMNALNYVVNLMASSERPTENDLYYNILKSLRQQLMKLK